MATGPAPTPAAGDVPTPAPDGVPAPGPGGVPAPRRRFSARAVIVAAAVAAVVLVGGGVAVGLALADDDDVPAAAPSPTPSPTAPPTASPTASAEDGRATPEPTPTDAATGTALYANPDTQAAEAAAAATGEARTLLTRIAETPQSFWVTDQDPAAAAAAVRDYTTRADDAGALGVLVVYAIPGRDCGLYSAGGVEGSAYATWVDAVAGAVVGKPWVVLEPDALPMLGDCEGQGDRVGYLRYAAEALTDAGARVYLDIGHAHWLSAEDAAARLNQVGLDHAVGFALNTSNYQTTADSIAYGERVSALTGGATYVVDTSRNGNGSDGEWCNPRGRALGEQPRVVDDDTALDALLWVKLPGESDGTCNGGPAAGEWFEEIALELARNAAG